jgi:hypothetical protein
VVNEEPACDPSVIFLVLPVSNFMLSIDDLTVGWGCVATTGGSPLFCIYIYIHGDYSVIDDRIIFCTCFVLLTTYICTT